VTCSIARSSAWAAAIDPLAGALALLSRRPLLEQRVEAFAGGFFPFVFAMQPAAEVFRLRCVL
jgi:hypothetical protein